jgi:hypothetical protein
MTADSGKPQDERNESRQPQERGGASDIDRSKGMGAEESDSPFGDRGEDDSKSKKEA